MVTLSPGDSSGWILTLSNILYLGNPQDIYNGDVKVTLKAQNCLIKGKVESETGILFWSLIYLFAF